MENLENLPTNVRQARLEKSKYYFTGIPCMNGHVDKRATRSGTCYTCSRKASNANYHKRKTNPVTRKLQILQRIRVRAAADNIEFNITVEDLDWVRYCPVFGYELCYYEDSGDSNVSIDRIDPNKGYVKGNVCVMSVRANRAKWNLSFDEVKQLYEYFLLGQQS